MIDYRSALMVNGILILIIGVALALTGMVDFFYHTEQAFVFFLSSVFTLFIGVMLFLTNRTSLDSFNNRTMFLMIGLSWTILPIFSSLPFMFGDMKLSFTDAYFEAVSGMTTTGATVITGLDKLPRSILIWRSLLQWMGGVGVVVMAISALPQLRLGGMQIFRMEFAERLDKALPRATQIGLWIGSIYLLLTSLCFIAYYMAGMRFFDAVNHAMTTVATGGFSTHDASFKAFQDPVIEWIAVAFMVLGSLPFLHYIQAVRGRPHGFWLDSQVRWFLIILLMGVAVIALWLNGQNDIFFGDALRLASFNTTSLLTGTGFASANYDEWGSFVQPVLFVLMFIGACAGSTTCGLKVFRLQVLAYAARAQMQRLLQPNAVIILYYNRRPLAPGVAESVMGFFFFYVMSFGALAIGLGATGLDFVTAASGAASAIANVGPGLGPIIGPNGTYQGLSDAAKWILSFGMLLGRLELFTLLILLTPRFWRQ